MFEPLQISDIPATASATPEVVVYGPEHCPQCRQSIDMLAHAGMVENVRKQVITADDPTYQRFVDAGAREAPIVEVTIPGRDPLRWTGLRPDLLLKLGRITVKA